jgi:triphosphoribosyl-dephospho-CoA synthase
MTKPVTSPIRELPLAQVVELACRLEVAARKPGNVHPDVPFADMTCNDFFVSAGVIAPILAAARHQGLGTTILEAVKATQATVGKNTNLGIILLLTPLAMVAEADDLASGVATVLRQTTVQDSERVYEAIRAAKPGGMGQAGQQDLADIPTALLVEIMRLAAGRDRIAEQYATDFRLVLDFGVPILGQSDEFAVHWEAAIIRLHLELMAHAPDTLIARKCGAEVAAESARRARQVLDAGWPATDRGQQQLRDLDAWLRESGNRRNPGTTADLVAACLFAAFRDGRIDWIDSATIGSLPDHSPEGGLPGKGPSRGAAGWNGPVIGGSIP